MTDEEWAASALDRIEAGIKSFHAICVALVPVFIMILMAAMRARGH